MQEATGIRKRLAALYGNLSPLDRALVQLCSVIYEPASPVDIYSYLHKTGLVFPGEDISDPKAIERRLARLQSLKLLDRDLRCHENFVESASRLALATPVTSKLGDDLPELESNSRWSDSPPEGAKCISCRDFIQGLAFNGPLGFVCASCVVLELKAAVAKEDLTSRSPKKFRDALSPEGPLVARLTVLWRLTEVLRTLSIVARSLAGEMLDLAVANLGYTGGHPMDYVVREAAVEACIERGERILRHLPAKLERESRQFYSNALFVAGSVAPRNPKVRKLLEDASRDPNAEVRSRVLAVLIQTHPTWALLLIRKLLSDPDPVVRNAGDKSALEKRRVYQEKRSLEVRWVSSAHNRFQLMAELVQGQQPLRRPYYDASASTCRRIMRDLRIAFYSQDMEKVRQAHSQIQQLCWKHYGQPGPLVRICANPFDPEWFRTLRPDLQVDALTHIFYNTPFTLDPDADALSYALDERFLASIPKERAASFFHYLISRLITGGQFEQARSLLEEVEKTTPLFGLRGWLLLLEGNYDSAPASFDMDIKAFWARIKSKSHYFEGIEGLGYILALLIREDEGLLNKAQKFIDSAIQDHHDASFMTAAYKSLRAVGHARNLKTDAARDIIARYRTDTSGLASFIQALAVFWIEGGLDRERIDALSATFMKSREIGLNWLAMECAELLCRTEGDTPIRRNFIEKVQRETGVRSFVAEIQIEELWRKRLRALIRTTAAPDSMPSVEEDSRLAWLFGFSKGVAALKPVEQKRTLKGTWSKGRAVALSRLFGENRPDFLTPQDRDICNAIDREGHYYAIRYYVDLNKALPKLADHPHIFLLDAPGVHVDVVRGDPEVVVAQSGAELLMRFSPEKADSRVVVVQETPTRFKVVELSEEHRKIAGIIGEEGLTVPVSARNDVLDAIAGISSRVTVHSAIGGAPKEIVELPADSIPRVHLAPSGAGFRVEMFVQPLGPEGLFLKPGQGMESVISEVGGRMVHTRRDLSLEESMADAVEAASVVLEATPEVDRQWLLKDPEECLQLLLDLKELQESGKVTVAWPEGEKLKISRELSFDRVRLSIRGKTDWFELSGELQVNDNLVVDMKRLLDLVHSSKTRFIPIGEGEFVALTRDLKRRLEELETYTHRHGKELRLHPLAALAVEELTDKLPQVETDKNWKERLDRIREGLDLSPSLPSTLKATLRDYQTEGYQWLARLAHLGFGACLADDMGLGKTVQALAVILKNAPEGPSLVIAPTSVCMNWVSEANRFAPTISVILFGNGSREQLIRSLGPMDLMVTSYGLLVQEAELFASVHWNTIVLDEAQAIKNVTTKRAQAAMSLKGSFRVITTGTPIENHLSELWTLFNFINPGLLGSRQKFNERFAAPIERLDDRSARKRLKKLIHPFILRRTKAQVLEELPPRTEISLQVELSAKERAFYEALRRQALERIELDNAPMAQKHLKILAEIMRLRQACCHPRMVVPGSGLPSAKIKLFGEVVEELLENGHKALVFSQFVTFLNLIREHLDAKGIRYRYLDGSTPPAARKRQVDLFQAGHGDLFLISLKAGGLGLNLTAADYVIHMDPWWNPAVEDQASDRAHRIGQIHPVTVYRLVTQNTIEEKIIKLHQEKRDLAGSLLDGSDMSGKVSAEELLKLLTGDE
ncbi:MAG: SNF2-related protein [Syntrophobacteraceae bacterium]